MIYNIYSKENCVFCEKAKALLEMRGLEYNELKYEQDFTRDELLTRFPQARTFPQIETNKGEYIGGFNQLEERLK
jgi:glutaredoxin 3